MFREGAVAPLSLMELTQFPLQHRPRALVITFMAARIDDGVAELLAHDVFVENLDEAGRLGVAGERGEITLTGGRNPVISPV